jgi:hypothetical protein
MSEVQSAIEEIEQIDLRQENAVEQIENIVKTKLRKLPIFLTDLKAGEPLVRARYLKDDEDYHYLVRDYSYNPFPEYIKIGRANYAGQPIFYGSRFRVTSLGEVRFIYANREKDEARYSLGRWEVVEKFPVAAIVTPELIREHNAKELFGLAEFIEEVENDYKNDKDMAGFIDIYRYMAKKYTEPIQEGEEHKYKITAIFSNFIYNKLPIANGILYQSVQYPENFNVALKKDVVDASKIKLTFCAKQKFLRIGHLHYREDASVQTDKFDYDNGKVIW